MSELRVHRSIKNWRIFESVRLTMAHAGNSSSIGLGAALMRTRTRIFEKEQLGGQGMSVRGDLRDRKRDRL
jgi:hypothetical protein